MATRMKGTFLWRLGTGGFSESLYAVDNASMTYQQCTANMLSLLNYRCALSVTGAIPGQPKPPCNNPLQIIAIRVEDELRKKDAFVTNLTATPSGYQYPPNLAEIYSNNMIQETAAKVQWNGSDPGQQAVTYLHGVPVVATDDDLTDFSSLAGLVDVPMSSTWLDALRVYAHRIRVLGMGLRFLNSPWDVGGAPGPMAIPISVNYNTVKEVYEFTMPQAALLFRTRYVLRGFKSLNFLNGRWPGLQLPADVIQIQKKARQVLWDGQGYVSPEVWNYFKPNETAPADPTQLPGAKYFFLTSKKIGRPFALPRGRARARVQ